MYFHTEICDVLYDFILFSVIPQLEVGSSPARVLSVPAAALLSSAAQQATLLAPTASATPAWGATERPHTPATTPTVPPAQVRPQLYMIYIYIYIYVYYTHQVRNQNGRTGSYLWSAPHFQTTTWTTLQELCPRMTAGLLFRSPTPQAWALCPTPPTPHLTPGKPFSTYTV